MASIHITYHVQVSVIVTWIIAPVIIAPAEIGNMERQKSTVHTAAKINHSLMNGRVGGGIKRPSTDYEESAKKKKKGEFLKGSIVRIRLHNFL